ncbi:hypothetical protein [Gulosibacter molinativorax]|uniref:Single-stranded DNA-binding protein n=1 Tax=Gulosibacter molinativorax TaxID=256821 RepID=A0ABT7C654_9MICO|nr:hypothetical protein [Gulosibacter molinativorax]MDJ1370654.1 hypothetical protein [Gulosibacter molinativorax]QUY63321.1 Hypotetical protein [Gulosibacter molinativorax]
MANITFEGYVQERRGKLIRVSEEYRVKDESGQWANAGYGDYSVWLRDDDSQPEIQPGAVVLVSGDLRVKKSEKDGKVYTNLNVSFAKVGITRTTQKYLGQAFGDAPQPDNSQWATQVPPRQSNPSSGQQWDEQVPF